MIAVGRTLTLVAGGAVALTVCSDAQTMSFEEYDPPSSLVVPEHRVTRAKYPFIDVHSHQSLSADYQRLSRRSEEHTSELQSPCNLVCRLLLEKKKKNIHLHP